MSLFRNRSTELAIGTTRCEFMTLSPLARPEQASRYPHRMKAKTTGFSFFSLDLTLTPEGGLRLIEANGSNAAMSSVPTGTDLARVEHMRRAFLAKNRGRTGPCAVLCAHEPGFVFIPEFFGRAGLFAELVSQDLTTALKGPSEELGDEEVTVIAGSIADIADHVTRSADVLLYRGRPIVFATNPNLLPALVRRKIMKTLGGGYDIDTSFYHEGPCTPVIHDKAVQQAICEGTGIEPLRRGEGSDFEACKQVIARFAKDGVTVVGKMNAGSGGAGIEVFPSSLSAEEAGARLEKLLASATKKYGASAAATAYPIRFFEFARSTDFMLDGRAHLWDMRFMCTVSPGEVAITPCVLRLCPAPFDPVGFGRDGCVSNLSGRAPTLHYARNPLDADVLAAVGLGTNFERVLDACGRWAEAAWIGCAGM